MGGWGGGGVIMQGTGELLEAGSWGRFVPEGVEFKTPEMGLYK